MNNCWHNSVRKYFAVSLQTIGEMFSIPGWPDA